jgi:signal transduction histidine kinase
MECGDSLEGDVAQMLLALGQQLGLFIRRTQVDDELERARREAENANYTKSLFLANMSHELRTPLNAIIGYSELILEEELPDSCAFVREDVDKIHSAGEYLLALVDNVLALSKLEADSLEFDVEEFELEGLVQELSSMFASAFQLRNNTLQVEMPKESVTLTTDRWKVQQVLSNLLSNACKYTSGGNVSLRFSIDASRERDWLVCVVEDNGRGIEESAIPLIFSAYTNFDISARGSEGSGLGLALCKRFCELLRGTIEVESKFGVGTRFCVQIPVVWPGKIRK